MAVSGYWLHCQRWSLVREPHDGGPFTVCRWRCGSWLCDACARVKAAGWYKRAMLGAEVDRDRLRVITLTYDHGDLAPWSCWRAFGYRWNKLHQALVRWGWPLEYLRVMEETKRGYPHAHILVRSDFIDQPVLSYLAGRSGLGRVAWINRPADYKQAGRYVVKYLLKSVSTSYPKGARRVVASRDWEAGQWQPKARIPDLDGTWTVWRHPPEEVRDNLLAVGKDVLYRDPLRPDPISTILSTLTD